MNVKSIRILLLEVGGSHDEVLLSWYRDLKSMDAEVYVACPAHVWKRLAITDAADWLMAHAAGGFFKRLKTIFRIRRFVNKSSITHIVLNTASGTTLRDISVMLPRRCVVIGTLHDASKLAESFNQSVTTRNVSAYTVLAPYLLDLVPAAFPKPVAVVTATAAEPRYRETSRMVHERSTGRLVDRYGSGGANGPLCVVIAGGINWLRRDYDSLFTADGFMRLGTNLRFVLAGGADPEDVPRLQQMLALAPPGMIEVHDEYIPHDTYARMISEADVVLPLTHPACRDYNQYVRSRITGAMSSAWTYAKPLMLERGFQKHTSLATSIFYDASALPDMLRTYSHDRSLLAPYAVTPVFATDDVRRATIVELLTKRSSIDQFAKSERS